jgi:hypothetical protein
MSLLALLSMPFHLRAARDYQKSFALPGVAMNCCIEHSAKIASSCICFFAAAFPMRSALVQRASHRKTGKGNAKSIFYISASHLNYLNYDAILVYENRTFRVLLYGKKRI